MKRVLLLLSSAALAGCAGEPLQPVELPAPAQYTPSPVEIAGLAPGEDLPAQWWTLFRAPTLDALVRQALDGSPTLARAAARLRQAEEDANARTGALQYPQVDAKLSAFRVDVDPQALGGPGLPVDMPLNLYLASVGVSYTFDIFGAARHELQALRAAVDVQRYQLEAARLALAANVVTAAVREASVREQLALTERLAAAQHKQLEIVERLEQLGSVAQGEVAARRLALARTSARMPDLRRQAEQLRHRLSVYTGQPPGSAPGPALRLSDLQAPSRLPLGLPSALARRRPDIRAAEALLAQAGERVGVATAQLYPQITLTASAGSLSSQAGDLFGGGTGFYLLGGSLVQPLFRGGELQARHRSAAAAYEEAGAAWREVVLQGLQEVADALRALEADDARLRERALASQQAGRLHEIAARRHQAGGISRLALLDAEQALLGAQLEQAQAVADRHADAAALFAALGGGWNLEPPAAP